MGNKGFLSLFDVKKPILGMLHLKGETPAEKMEIAKREFEIYRKHGVDAAIVENYFAEGDDVERVLEYVQKNADDMIYGVNYLRDDAGAFDLANRYGCYFLQMDSVAGHVTVEDDVAFGEFMEKMRAGSKAYVLGGVRFKYQPYLSGRSLEEDLNIGKTRADGIVVTGTGTGVETDMDKIKEFRGILGEDYPLIIGAGMTPDNCEEQLAYGDGAVVGSYFKVDHVDKNDMCEENVKYFMDKIREVREKL